MLPPKSLSASSQRVRHAVVVAAVVAASQFWGTRSVLAAPTAPTTITNQATGSFTDISDNDIKPVVSNIVRVSVAEVAGVSVTVVSSPSNVRSGQVVYFDFTIKNTGNDPTQFTIPDVATIVGGTLKKITIIAADPNNSGTAIVVNKDVPAGGIDTGDVNALDLPGGAILPDGTIRVRVAVIVTAGANSTVSANLAIITKDNIDYTPSNNLPSSETSGAPLGGEKTANDTGAVTTPPLIRISGNIWYDTNLDLINNHAELLTTAGSNTLTVYAVDPNGLVVDKAAVGNNGTYTLTDIPANSNFTLRLSIDSTVSISANAPTSPSLPKGWFNTGESLDGTIDNISTSLGDIAAISTVLDLANYNFGIAKKPPLVLLVKRITKLGNVDLSSLTQSSGQPYDPLNHDSFDTHPNWPTKYIKGVINATSAQRIKPGDEIEYTIYFMNVGEQDAAKVKICDLLTATQAYVPTTYNAYGVNDGGIGPDAGILLNIANQTPTPLYLNGIPDGDRGLYFAPGVEPDSRCNISATNNVAGVVMVDITRNTNISTDFNLLKQSTVPETPDSYGFIRFHTVVK